MRKSTASWPLCGPFRPLERFNEMRVSKNTTWIIGGTAVAVGGGVALYLLIRNRRRSDQYGNVKLKKKKAGGISGGVVTATGNRGTTLSEPNWNNAFDMNYEDHVKKWVAPKRIVLPNEGQAREWATTLHQAKSGGKSWWDRHDEEAVQQVFGKRLRDKVQVARLSRVFWSAYQTDLWEYLNGFLSSSEMERYVQKPVRNLPNYRLA